MELANDRKHIRAGQSNVAQSNNMEFDFVQNNQLFDIENADPNVHFLSAGPGAQACRQP